MKRIISTLFGIAVLCLFAEAHAVPTTVSFTGRLTTSNGPVSGPVNITFRLFDLATNGTVMWTETRNNLTATNGLVYADLGALTTLDEGILLNAPLFLEIQVGNEVLTPRLPLQSVPYAIRTEVANTADTLGTIAPGDVVTTVTATGGGLSAVRTGNTVSITGTGVSGTAPINVAAGVVSLVTCPTAGHIYKMVGGAWSCQPDANTPPTATAPLSVTGVNVALTTCPTAGHIYKMVGGAWSCQPDADTPPTATAPLAVTGNNVALTTCPNPNQIYKMVGGAWTCSTDNDTLPTAGIGISVTGSTVSVDNAIVARKDSGGGNQAFDTNVLFLDYTNNRVGVNNASPGAGFALDVTGGVRATSLQYSAPLSTSVIAHPTLCTRALSSADPHLDTEVVNAPNAFGPSISSVAAAANSTLNFVCPVNLYIPPGATATLTGASMAYYDGSGTCRVSAEIRTKTFGASSTGTVQSTVFNGADASDFAFTGGPTTVAFPAFSVAVSTNTVVFVHATIAYNATGGGDCRYTGALLNYTIDRP